MRSIYVITVIRLEQHQKKTLHLGLNHLSTRHLPDYSTATAQPVHRSLSKLCCYNFTAHLPCCNPSTCRSCKDFTQNGLENEKDIMAIASQGPLQVCSCSWHPSTSIASQWLQEVRIEEEIKLPRPSMPLPVPMQSRDFSGVNTLWHPSFWFPSSSQRCLCPRYHDGELTLCWKPGHLGVTTESCRGCHCGNTEHLSSPSRAARRNVRLLSLSLKSGKCQGHILAAFNQTDAQ